MNYRYRLPLHHLQEEKWRKRKRNKVKLDQNLLLNLKAAALLFRHRMECKLSPTERSNLSSFHQRIKGRRRFIMTKCVFPNPPLLSGHIMFTSLPHNDKIVTLGLNHNSHSYKIHVVHQPLVNKRILISFSTFYCERPFPVHVHSDCTGCTACVCLADINVNQSKCPKMHFSQLCMIMSKHLS